MGLINADRRTKLRKVKDYLKSYAGIIIGATILLTGIVIYMISLWNGGTP